MHDENYLIKSDTLEDIADAIRDKKQSQETIAVSDFANEIENLPSSDPSEYFYNSISGQNSFKNMIKKVPPIEISGTTCNLMFYQCLATEIDTSLWDTSNITTFQQMFQQCTNLTSLDLSNLNTSKVTNFSSMFDGCTALTSLNVNFTISKATTLDGMFYSCTSLTSLDLSNWEFSENTCRTGPLFANCTSLQHLDIRKFQMSRAYGYSGMYSNVPNDCEIIVKNATEKTWLANNWPNLTNVKTVAEYEAQ